MNKKIMFFSLVMLTLLTSFVMADDYDDNLYIRASCDGSITNLGVSGITIYNNNSVTFSSGYASFNISGTTGTQYCNFSNNDAFLSFGQPSFDNYTFSVWFKAPTIASPAGLTSSFFSQFGTANWYNACGLEADTGKLRMYEQRGSASAIHALASADCKILDSSWHHFVMRSKKGSTIELFLDGGQIATAGTTANTNYIYANTGNVWGIGLRIDRPDLDTWEWDWAMADIRVYNTSLSNAAILNITNYGNPAGTLPPGPVAATAPTVNLLAPSNSSTQSSSKINISYNVTNTSDSYLINATLCTNRSGVLNCNLTNTSTVAFDGSANFFYNIDFSTEGTYIYNVYACDNNTNCSYAPANYTFNIRVYNIVNTTFSNYFTYSTKNYTRTLSYSVGYSCKPGFTAHLLTYVNGILNKSSSLSCSSSGVYSSTYLHDVEGEYKISFNINTTNPVYTTSLMTSNFSFQSDLHNPNITIINISVTRGFTEANTTLNVTCVDNIFPLLYYNITYNNLTMVGHNYTNATLISNTTKSDYGSNTLQAWCSDPFGSDRKNTSISIYYINISLIDEVDNDQFDLSDCLSARIYYDDNSTYFDFKAAGNVSNYTFTSTSNEKLRVVLGYDNNITITRYIDVSLVGNAARICANKEGVTHYEQLIISATNKPVVLKNVFSNCYVAADYIRFAYQDAFVLKAYTIDSLYYLYTYEGSLQSILASLDGSISSYVNVDQLQFQETAYNLNLLGDSLNFQQNGSSTMKIYYKNLQEDNTEATITIERMDTDSIVFSTSDFSNPNEFTLYFDYTTLANVTNETMFKITGTFTKTDGTVETMKRYFNTAGKTGILTTAFAFVIALGLTLFGLSVAATRLTFSWFGIVIMLAAIGITTLAVSEWYLMFFQVIQVIVTVFLGIVLVKQNYPTIS